MDQLFGALGFSRVEKDDEYGVLLGDGVDIDLMDKLKPGLKPIGFLHTLDSGTIGDPLDYPFNHYKNYCGKCGRELSTEKGCELCMVNKIKVGITGAGGYIAGSVIDLLLKNGYEVIAFDNNFKQSCDTLLPFVPNPRFKFMVGDVTSDKDIDKLYSYELDYLIHFAALVGAPICQRYHELATLVNVEGTKKLINKKPDSVKFCYSSTGSVYKPGQGECDETAIADPPSHYGWTKKVSEDIVLSSPNTAVWRFATLMGCSFASTRVNLLVNDLTYRAQTERAITVFESKFLRSFLHVRDAARAIVATVENFDDLQKYENRIFNIGSDSLNMSKGDLCEMIKQKTGCHVDLADVNSDPDKRDYLMINGKFQKATGWTPSITMEETLDEIIKFTPLLTSWQGYR